MTKLLDNLLAQASAIDREIRDTAGIAWYRGHTKSEYPLVSTLHRHVERMSEPAPPEKRPEMRDYLRGEYKTLYRTFMGEAWPLLSDGERSEWGVIFAMAHYGIPTRLLDWTESFGCALFFAQLGRVRGDAAAVWVLNPERLNERTIGRDGIVTFDDVSTPGDINTRLWHPRYMDPPQEVELPTIAVAPLFANQRMLAQRSRFTLSGDSFLPLDQQNDGQLIEKRILFKIEIPPELFDELDDYLRVFGLRAFTFFPDFHGLKLEHETRVDRTVREINDFLQRERSTAQPEDTQPAADH